LLEDFETIANLNCELSTKIEQLESSAPSSATDDDLIKKNEKLKAKLASSQEAIENLLEKIGSTPEVSLIEIPKIIKKDASTSCFNLIDDSNPATKFVLRILL
jgi:FtsZ-binding cell division protein ZapB